MLQTMMCEQLGREQTLKVFDRLRNPKPETENAEEPATDWWRELAICQLPVRFQLIYRAHRLEPKPVDPQKAARRESVLQARGLKSHAFDNPPAKAEWIHTAQKRASDAFSPMPPKQS